MATDISKSSFDQLVDLINQENDILLLTENVTMSPPLALVDDVDGKNTELTITALPNKGYTGAVSVKYNRMNLDEFQVFGGEEPILISIPENGDFESLVYFFNSMMGSNLSIIDDLVVEAIAAPSDTIVDVVLTAKSDSLAWQGELLIQYQLSTIPLATIISTTNLEGLRYFDGLNIGQDIILKDLPGFTYGASGDSTIQVGAQYCYNLDFTPYSTLLSSTTVSTVVSGVSNPLSSGIVAMLQYVDLDGVHRNNWKSNGATGGNNEIFNVNGATVVYNGLNEPQFPTNQKYKYVMELELRNDQTSPRGNLYFGYNVAIDPLNAIDPNV